MRRIGLVKDYVSIVCAFFRIHKIEFVCATDLKTVHDVSWLAHAINWNACHLRVDEKTLVRGLLSSENVLITCSSVRSVQWGFFVIGLEVCLLPDSAMNVLQFNIFFVWAEDDNEIMLGFHVNDNKIFMNNYEE